jgi:serine/threonine protein phosphatase PrpC
MPWTTIANSDIGDREEQQDRYLVEHSDDGCNHLLVVADGAGGHKAGALAAQTAIDCIRANLEFLWPNPDPESFLEKLISECNERVLAVGDGELACSTLVLVFMRGDEIFWGHVGDSRFYLTRGGEEAIKTIDHSVIELQRQQATKSADIPVGIASNELYMCLGALVDIVPETGSSLAKEGDILLLCSDGLWGQLDMKQLIAEVSEKPLNIDFLSKWIEKARNSKPSSSDNITLVAAEFIGKPRFFSNPLKAIIGLFKNH